MHRFAVVLLILAAAAAVPAAASASGTLTVKKNIAKAGTVTAGFKAINCGLDCVQDSEFFANECDGEGICTPQDVAIGVALQPGWAVSSYDGCSDGGEEFCSVWMSTSHTVTVNFADVADPSIAISGPVAGSTVRGGIGFSATAGDNDGVDRVEFYLDGNHVGTDNAAPYEFGLNTATIADGAHSVSARSFDYSSRASGHSARAFVVDNGKPTVELTGGVAEHAIVGASGTAALAFAAADAVSGVNLIECAVQGGGWTTCDTTAGHQFSGLAEGDQVLLVRARDGAGNYSDVAARSVKVDKTAPSGSITGGPEDGALIGTAAAVAYTFDYADAITGIAGVACGIDGALGTCSEAKAHSAGGIADGPHTFDVRITDLAGNVRTLQRAFTVDATAPAVAITSGPGAGAVLGSAAVEFGFTATDATSAVTERICAIDGVAGACDSATGHALSGLGHGEHTFTLKAIDLAGNAATVSRTFTVDLVAPETTIDTESGGTFTFSASEPGSTFRCRLYAAGATPPAFGECAGAAGSHSTTGLAPGSYVFEVVATDAAGNVDGSPASRAFKVSASAPTTPAADTGSTGTTTTTTTTTTVTTVNGVQKITSGVDWEFDRRGKRTRVKSLRVSGVPAGATVEVHCKARGCAFKKKAFSARNGRVELRKSFRRMLTAPGTFEVRIVAPNAIGKVVAFKLRPKAKATYRVLCMNPGAARPAAC